MNKPKTLCLMPWIHLMASSYNKVYPCCLADTYEVGDLLESNLREMWNSASMKELRLSMLRGEKPSACSKCYNAEELGGISSRIRFNDRFSDSVISTTNPDGSLNDFNLKRWDLRFSNLCNFRCRTCNHHSSTQWYQEEVKLNPGYSKPVLMKAGKTDYDVLNQLLEHIDVVEEIYFAGGEPLVMEEHYIILDELVKRKRFNVRLFYNTNLSKLRFKDKLITDYWAQFSDVVVGASIDGTGQRAEYIRKETNWAEIENNILTINKECPNAIIRAFATVSIFNALDIPDMYTELVSKNLIMPGNMRINFLYDPMYLRCDIASERYREALYKKYTEYSSILDEQTANDLITIKNFMSANNYSKIIPLFWKKTKELDLLRNESALAIIPELSLLNE